MVDKEITVPEQEMPAFVPDEGAIREAADEILRRFSAAKSPLIMVGVEVDRFRLNEPALTLAKRLGVPIVSDFLGRDVMPRDEPYYFGTYLGTAGNPVARELVENSDCLLLLGTILADMNLGLRLKKLKKENLILCISRKVLMGHHQYDEVPLGLLVADLLGRNLQRKSLPVPSQARIGA